MNARNVLKNYDFGSKLRLTMPVVFMGIALIFVSLAATLLVKAFNAVAWILGQVDGGETIVSLLPYFILIFVACAAAYVVAISLWKVPPVNYAVPIFLGMDMPFVFRSGPRFWFPTPIGSMEFINLKPRMAEVDVIFQLKDEVELTSKVTTPYVADSDLSDPKTGVNVFFRIADKEQEVLKPQFKRLMEEKFGGLGGKITSGQFLKKQEAVGLYLNLIFRTKTPPHLEHLQSTCGVTGCKLEDGKIPANQLLQFYGGPHWRSADEVLRREKENPTQRSSFETDWGIDIGRLTFSQPRFSAETQKAREAKKQVEERVGAVHKKIELIKRAEDVANLSPSDAQAAVEKVLQPGAQSQFITIQGNSGGNMLVLDMKKGGKQ